jgi:hypothetical protein
MPGGLTDRPVQADMPGHHINETLLFANYKFESGSISDAAHTMLQ